MDVKYGQRAERNYEMFQRRKNGETYAQIGKDYGVTPSRVMQICNMQKIAEKCREEAVENERFVVVMRNGIKSICVKQILGTYRDGKMVIWKTPGSSQSSRCLIDKVSVLSRAATEKDANEIVDSIFEALAEEEDRHIKKKAEILYRYSERP